MAGVVVVELEAGDAAAGRGVLGAPMLDGCVAARGWGLLSDLFFFGEQAATSAKLVKRVIKVAKFLIRFLLGWSGLVLGVREGEASHEAVVVLKK
jgi:hypothetical protein